MEKWFVAAKKADFDKWAEEFHISPVLARILRNRDLEDVSQVSKFLYGTLEDCYSPLRYGAIIEIPIFYTPFGVPYFGNGRIARTIFPTLKIKPSSEGTAKIRLLGLHSMKSELSAGLLSKIRARCQ